MRYESLGTKQPDSSDPRFLFLGFRGEHEQYNKFEGRIFDELIEAELVTHVESGYYELNEDHKRNKRAMKLVNEISEMLAEYENEYGPRSEEHLFDYNLSNSEAWSELLDMNVDG